MPYIPQAMAETESSRMLAKHLGPAVQGKVRDVYDCGDRLLIVTTDRVSSDDHVLGQEIVKKGYVLNGISVFWFDKGLDPDHHLEVAGQSIDRFLPALLRGNPDLQARSMFVRKTKPIRIECVARGYLAGSGWKDYLATGRVCGIKLPKGMREGDRLPRPIFTPATKASSGHDINITEAEAAELVPGGMATVRELKRRTLRTYTKGAQYAEAGGIIIADTKFEYGLFQDCLLLIDEVLTPDSSRFWPKPRWLELQAKDGGVPASLDKQPLRDYLKQFGFSGMTDEEAGKVVLPEEVRDKLSRLYLDLLERITGKDLNKFLYHSLGVIFAPAITGAR